MSSVVERLRKEVAAYEESIRSEGDDFAPIVPLWRSKLLLLQEAIAEIERLEKEQERRARVFAALQAVAADLVEENERQEAGLLKYREALERIDDEIASANTHEVSIRIIDEIATEALEEAADDE